MTEPTKASDQDASDPSMEEILASIRRILNEDETSAPPGAPQAMPPAPSPPPQAAAAPARAALEHAVETDDDDDVLVLEPSMLVSAPIEDPAPPAPVPQPVAFAEPPPAEPPPAEPSRDEPPPVSFDPGLFADSALMAPETSAAAASSVGGLLRTLAASRSTQVYRGGPTIEDLVREEIRPLLKEWLDGHLPGLVERLVRAEIERVVGRAVS
jgi:uncharacterized protein